jgi:hypothetical protein
MTAQTPDLEAILERLEKLERQNRWPKRAGVAALVLLASTLLAGFATQRPAKHPGDPETVEAQRFVLKNARGDIRAELSLDDGEPRLVLRDGQGMPRALLSLATAAPSIVLHNDKGEPRTIRGSTAGEPSLTLYGGLGKGSVMLDVSAGEPTLTLFGSQVKSNATLYVSLDGPSLEVSDAAGFKAVVGTAELETIRTGESHRTSAASVVLFNKDGKVIWRTP